MKQKRCVPLEAAAEDICNQSAVSPRIYELPPTQGREVLERLQDKPVSMYPADISRCMADTGRWGRIPLYFVTPLTKMPVQNVIFYIHGGGWVFGSFHTHEKLVRELAARTDSLVIFPEYSRSPEAKYPTAIEQCCHILSHIWEYAAQFGADAGRCSLTVAGDSAGGNMAAALILMTKQQGGPRIDSQLLYYPVTDACFDTPSYRRFACGFYLYRVEMMWFWRQYISCEADLTRMTAAPLRIPLRCLRDFPKTLIVNGQADVLRSEGEAFGERLLRAGVDLTALQVQGTIHDFVMLNALDRTNACRAAMNASTEWLGRQ